MLELIAGTALAAAAGLNAYIPLLGLGLLARFTDLVQLPDGWAWIANDWSLWIIGVLLVAEILVDKIPALDSFNDVLQTAVRPASGGMVFAAGSSSDTFAVPDPAAFIESAQFWPFVLGMLVALIPHLLKTLVRPLINVISAGIGAAVMSFLEDLGAVVLTVLAVLLPLLALVVLVVLVVWLARWLRRGIAARRA